MLERQHLATPNESSLDLGLERTPISSVCSELPQLLFGLEHQLGPRRSFKCACRKLGVDEQRARYLLLKSTPTKQPDRDANTSPPEVEANCHLQQLDSELELEQFNGLPERNELVRRLFRAKRAQRRWHRPEDVAPSSASDTDELTLYKLEQYLAEAHQDLSRNLARFHGTSFGNWPTTGPDNNGHVNEANDNNNDFDDAAMIRAPTEMSVVGGLLRNLNDNGVRLVAKVQCGPFGAGFSLRNSSCSSQDSGYMGDMIDARLPVLAPEPATGSHTQLLSLDEFVRFRAHAKVQRLVAHSQSYFENLLAQSPLFRLEKDADSLKSLRQLQMFVCVECQKMRSRLRHDWLPKCLTLAPLNGDDLEQISSLARPCGSRPKLGSKPVGNTNGSGNSYSYGRAPARPKLNAKHLALLNLARPLDLLARLMARLLRQHFLEPALNKWCRLVERHLLPPSTLAPNEQDKVGTKLLVFVRLLDNNRPHNAKTTGAKLECSQPNREIGETLGAFVVAELAAVCCRLPRLEALLESLNDSVESDGHSEWLQVLRGPGDTLLDDARGRLTGLIDRALVGDAASSGAIRAEYLAMVKLVETFRCDAAYWSVANSSTGLEPRLKQLRRACQQLELLRHQEGRLVAAWPPASPLEPPLWRHYDHGLVLLDYGPLRESLRQQLQREQLILKRLVLDDLARLMQRLELEFGELEPSLRLEQAIEDYLAERRQLAASLFPAHLESFEEDGAADVGHITEQTEIGASLEPTRNEIGIVEAERGAGMGIGIESDEHESFLATLTGANGNIPDGSQQLLALGGVGGAGSGDWSGQGGRVAPLIECRLLVGKFERLAELIGRELRPLREDTQVALEGLIFLSEFTCFGQLDDTGGDKQRLHTGVSVTSPWWHLIAHLAEGARQVELMLLEAHQHLQSARKRLLELNATRSSALSKLVVEFHLLMSEMAHRKLQHDGGQQEQSVQPTPSNLSLQRPAAVSATQQQQLAGSAQAARQLDSIQETSEWAQELELRHEFLERQNKLLAREASLLTFAQLSAYQQTVDTVTSVASSPRPMEMEIEMEEEAFRPRRELLERWRRPVALVANLWSLAEVYETQQVKWLSSDIKRIDYRQLEQTFHQYQLLLNELRRRANGLDDELDHRSKKVLELNLDEMGQRLDLFRRLRLPQFRFLTNRHLSERHWSKLNELLRAERPPSSMMIGGGLSRQDPQTCTTLAQFLELNLDKFVKELEQMNQEANLERELTLFLACEANRCQQHQQDAGQLRALAISRAWFSGWTDAELVVAASRYMEMKLGKITLADQELKLECHLMANLLVAIHSQVKRYLQLSYHLNLNPPQFQGHRKRSPVLTATEEFNVVVTLRECRVLNSPVLVTPAMFIGFLKLATESWIERRQLLNEKVCVLRENLKQLGGHLEDFHELVERVHKLRETDVREAWLEADQVLVALERQKAKLELEREILATKEALAMERQREALAQRDNCVRQIAERAIPAIRAAAKALDCLDGGSLRALRYLRPHPPEPIRQVLEAVCLLRSSYCSSIVAGDNNKSATNQQHQQQLAMVPERRFDSLRGLIVEDYWPATSRMLNGTHTCRLVADLRQVDKRQVPQGVMRLIRRRYLSSPKLSQFARSSHLERVSRECAHLARWLLAVDVFDRVINVVKPNYKHYQESERRLGKLLAEVQQRRRQLETVGVELREMEETLERRMGHRLALVQSLDQCRHHLNQVERSQSEIQWRRRVCGTQLERLERRRSRLAARCATRAARLVYLAPMSSAGGGGEPEAMTGLLTALCRSSKAQG